MEYLKGERREARLDEVVMELCAEMLVIGGIERDRSKARARADAAVTSGDAAEVFDRMVAALGGPEGFVGSYGEHLPEARVVRPVEAGRDGYVARVDAFEVGNAIITLGGGRRKLDDRLDLSVGFTEVVPVGAEVQKRAPLAMVHAKSAADAEEAAELFRKACRIADARPEGRAVVYARLTGD